MVTNIQAIFADFRIFSIIGLYVKVNLQTWVTIYWTTKKSAIEHQSEPTKTLTIVHLCQIENRNENRLCINYNSSKSNGNSMTISDGCFWIIWAESNILSFINPVEWMHRLTTVSWLYFVMVFYFIWKELKRGESRNPFYFVCYHFSPIDFQSITANSNPKTVFTWDRA